MSGMRAGTLRLLSTATSRSASFRSGGWRSGLYQYCVVFFACFGMDAAGRASELALVGMLSYTHIDLGLDLLDRRVS